MDISTLKRNPEALKKAMVRRGDKVLAKERLRIMIPEYYTKRGLAELGVENYILAIYAIITDSGNYAVSNAPALIHVNPSSITQTKVDDLEYLILEFEPGSPILVNDQVIRDELLIYPIFNDILGKGRVPWFMNDFNTGYVLDGAEKYTGSNLGKNRKAVQTLISLLARDPNDPHRQYRHAVSTFEEVDKVRPLYSSIRNVQFMASNTFTKVAGSYFSAGLNSGLVTTTDRIEPIERVLR